MNRRYADITVALVASAVVAAVFLVPSECEAIPAFGRRHEMSCNVCHSFAYPKLNAFGRRFKENGYQLPPGAEDSVRARRQVEPGTAIEKLAIFKELPVSVRIQNKILAAHNADDEGLSDVEFDFPSNASLIGGGSLYKDVAAFFSWSFAPDSDLHYMFLSAHNLWSEQLGEGSLNARIGKFLLQDWNNPHHRHLTALGRRITSVQVGQNPFTLESHQEGLQIWGRPNYGPFFYEAAVVGGASNHATGGDLDNFKDFYGRGTWQFNQRHTLGLGGYVGKTEIESDVSGVQRRFEDNIGIGQADLELDLGRLLFYFQGLYGRHSDPNGDGEAVAYWGGHGMAHYAIRRDLLGIMHFDFVESDDDPSLEETWGTINLTYLYLTNFKLGLEWQARFDDFDKSRGLVLVEAAF